jgi:cobalt/nickel transport system permease protein
MLQGAVCPVTAGLGLLGVTAAALIAARGAGKQDLKRFAAVASLLFAGQMFNFPVANGTSGHLIGGVLAAALLGTPLAVLAMTLVLALQTALFGDGGLLSLGANIVNMALIGVGVGALMRHFTIGRSLSAPRRMMLAFGAGWLSVMLSALAASMEWAASGTVPLSQVVPAMLATHAWIGIGEGLVTAAFLELVATRRIDEGDFSSTVPAMLLSGILVLASPWASALPDGLQRVAERLGFLSVGDAILSAPLDGYSMAVISDPRLALMAAGLIGLVSTFVSARLLGWRLCRAVCHHDR